MKYLFPVLFVLFFTFSFTSFGQRNSRVLKQEQCATMINLATKLDKNPLVKEKYLQQLSSFNKLMNARKAGVNRVADVTGTSGITYTVPIVFHIVLTDPTVVTDDQIFKQLKVLNQDFAGIDADSVGIPSYFKSLHGKSNIQFCLAQRTPDGDVTTGIDRIVTSKTSFVAGDNGVKHTSTGGVDLWDETKYYNVWVCVLGNNILGYATFPTDGETTEQGVAIHYESLPGAKYDANSTYNNYNLGKTLTHETGHYFNLYHIWGDDNGACTGTDFIDDTPNQGNSTSGCYEGIKTDNCTTTGNGILYENYMDYSNDQCLLLFTPEQDDRMQMALLNYRSSLLTSNGCKTVILHDLDAQLKAIAAPVSRVCTNIITPAITIRNRGGNTLSSVNVTTVIDKGAPIKYNWTGTLVSLDTTTINLPAITIAEGIHNMQIFLSSPNGAADQNTSNDTLITTIQFFAPVPFVAESFEGFTFPPAGWDIVNPDHGITWKKSTDAAFAGTTSVMIDNADYQSIGQLDYLRLPNVKLTGVDSAFFSFEVAAATYTPTITANNNWDTLEVLLSTDCGHTYTNLYKKWGATLKTRIAPDSSFYIPTTNEWRKDSIDITPYINNANVLIAFRNTCGFENNIYLDNINVRTITINPNLKAKGFLVTPNPAKNNIQVQFYPNPINLKGIALYSLMGQKLAAIEIDSPQAATLYNFDLSPYPTGMYIVRAVYTDKVLVKKIIKH